MSHEDCAKDVFSRVVAKEHLSVCVFPDHCLKRKVNPNGGGIEKGRRTCTWIAEHDDGFTRHLQTNGFGRGGMIEARKKTLIRVSLMPLHTYPKWYQRNVYSAL
ncbi:MAG: hypothetical protein QGH62_04090 [Nitrospinaceae bacterium]|nr:hypothetical protein [Nitrospinaceae bacterium]